MTRTPPAPLLQACRRLLRPLVRLMMRSGVTFPVLTDLLRQLFVEVAVTDILTEPKARTDSRISLLTGIHRKEIRRDRETHSGGPADKTTDGAAAPEAVTTTSQIIATWLGSPPFIDEAGQPRPLPRVAAPGAGASFDQLVASVTTDIRARAVLDDWLSQGIVRMAPSDHVVLNEAAFIPRPGAAEQLFYFARNLHDHVAASVANISAGETAPFLDRSVHYDELTPDQARVLEEYARATAVRALLDVNRKALELVGAGPGAERGAVGGKPLHRINFGVFVFGDSDAPASDQPNQPHGAAA